MVSTMACQLSPLSYSYNSGLVLSSAYHGFHHHCHAHFYRSIHRTRTRHTLPRIHLSLPAQARQIPTVSLTNSISAHQDSTLRDITKLCESGNLAEAFDSIKSEFGNVVSSLLHREAVSVLLQACGKHKDIEIGRKAHLMVSGSIQFSNDFVLNTRLITMYAICGSPLESRSLFDGLQRKNLFLWNALLSGYTKNNIFDEAIRLFVELISATEFKPDNFTLPCVIKACGGLLDVRFGKVLHGIVLKMGLISDVFVGNALIAMYGKCGFIQEAKEVFELMPERNLVSWNSLIHSFSDNGSSQDSYYVFREMLENEKGLVPDVATLVTILPVCSAEGDTEMGMLVHGLAVKLGLNKELKVNNALVDMYSKNGFLHEAQILFDSNNNKNVVSWNTMIGGFSTVGYINGTFHFLRKMVMEEGVIKANEITILNVLPVCSGQFELLSLKELHGYSFRHGFQSDEMVANGFVAAYAKCGSLRYAEHAFYGMETKTVSSWNALIGGYAQNDDPKKALELYYQMIESSLEPDSFTIGSLLLACRHLEDLRLGKEIHGYVLRTGLEKDEFINISLLSLYIHCGNSSCARVLFNGMEDKSIVSWNAMINGYSQNKLPDEALSLFRRMLSDGVLCPHEIAITSVFGACSQLSALRLGKEVHCYAVKAFYKEDIFVSCSMIDMYAKCGSLELSERVFNRLKHTNLISYNTMISGYGVHGHGNKAIDLFKKMQELGHKPDDYTFIGILMACSHAGLVKEGMKYFKEMHSLHGIEPKLEHYACVVDMLSRAGQLAEAFSVIDKMSGEPDIGMWSSLLSSCRTHGDLDIGEKVARRVLELEPDNAEIYVLISNFFAASGKWEDVRNVRQRMKEIGLQKEAGRSWIELGSEVFSFTVGDNLMPESEEIRDMWRKVEERICEIGYKPNTASVLHKLEEEEKIEILRGHSEKLAISFGLLKTPKGVKLRVSKNLRICVDCHNAAKLISKVAGRDIIIRDNKRFHHFKDGSCSCGDYW